MKQVVMCPGKKCCGEHIAAFEELMKSKDVEFKADCIAGDDGVECCITTPACRVDGALIQADTVEQLAALV